MKKIFTTDKHSNAIDLALLIGRIAFATLMLVHGLPKMATLISGNEIQFPSVFGMSASLSLALAVFAEVICSILLLVGFATRLATVPLIVTMLVAVFSIHAADVFAKKELGLLYLAGYLVLLIAGSGKYSIGNLFQHHQSRTVNTNHKLKGPILSIYDK